MSKHKQTATLIYWRLSTSVSYATDLLKQYLKWNWTLTRYTYIFNFQLCTYHLSLVEHNATLSNENKSTVNHLIFVLSLFHKISLHKLICRFMNLLWRGICITVVTFHRLFNLWCSPWKIVKILKIIVKIHKKIVKIHKIMVKILEK